MVRHGAAQLIDAENAVEAALCKVAGLITTLGEMRLNANLSTVIGQEAMDALAASTVKLAEARGTMIVAHNGLNGVKTQIGCRTVAAGTLDKPEDDKRPPTIGLVDQDRGAA